MTCWQLARALQDSMSGSHADDSQIATTGQERCKLSKVKTRSHVRLFATRTRSSGNCRPLKACQVVLSVCASLGCRTMADFTITTLKVSWQPAQSLGNNNLGRIILYKAVVKADRLPRDPLAVIITPSAPVVPSEICASHPLERAREALVGLQ